MSPAAGVTEMRGVACTMYAEPPASWKLATDALVVVSVFAVPVPLSASFGEVPAQVTPPLTFTEFIA